MRTNHSFQGKSGWFEMKHPSKPWKELEQRFRSPERHFEVNELGNKALELTTKPWVPTKV